MPRYILDQLKKKENMIFYLFVQYGDLSLRYKMNCGEYPDPDTRQKLYHTLQKTLMISQQVPWDRYHRDL
jgi:hypothetical protein